jgi:uncharacterized protein (TIGR02757 family)
MRRQRYFSVCVMETLYAKKTLDRQDLEALYHRYNDKKYIQYDPIKYVYRFEDPLEQEVVALIASSLAFGRVTQIFKAMDHIMEIAKGEPLGYISALDDTPGRELLSFQYRFVRGADIHRFFKVARSIIKTHGSLGSFMRQHYRTGQFLGLVEEVTNAFQSVHYLVPCSLKGSACKRLFMFFRWMVREDNIDLGLWDFISPAELIIPLDTHIFQVATALKLTRLRTPSLAAALEITENLRKYSRGDPVKYDWALSHQGLLANNFRAAPALS